MSARWSPGRVHRILFDVSPFTTLTAVIAMSAWGKDRGAMALFLADKNLAERAMGQMTDEQLLGESDSEMNSIAVIVKHMADNVRSRWTDFLASD